MGTARLTMFTITHSVYCVDSLAKTSNPVFYHWSSLLLLPLLPLFYAVFNNSANNLCQCLVSKHCSFNCSNENCFLVRFHHRALCFLFFFFFFLFYSCSSSRLHVDFDVDLSFVPALTLIHFSRKKANKQKSPMNFLLKHSHFLLFDDDKLILSHSHSHFKFIEDFAISDMILWIRKCRLS